MIDAATYLTGAQTRVFAGERLEAELDVRLVTVVEEGVVVPLYSYFDYRPERMAYGTRLVSGALQFNFTYGHTARFRSGSAVRPDLQGLHNATLTVVTAKIDHKSESGLPRLVRDTIRLIGVWEHPFEHTPEGPGATEVVPFTAHSLHLVERELYEIDGERLAAVALEEAPRTSPDDLSRRREMILPARLVRVVDGDTLLVEAFIDGHHIAEAEVRLIAVQTPETRKDQTEGRTYTKNVREYWTWPASAPERPGEMPTHDELEAWAAYITTAVEAWTGGPGAPLFLVRDPGSRRMDDYGRHLFQVRRPSASSPTGFDDLETFLIESGYAVTNTYPSLGFDETGRLVSRKALLEERFRAVYDKAGTEEAVGIWRSFTPPGYEAP